MAVLLLVASAIYLSLGDLADSIVTLAALVPITAVSLLLEVRAERALAGLRRLTAPTAHAWRDGAERMVTVAEPVPATSSCCKRETWSRPTGVWCRRAASGG